MSTAFDASSTVCSTAAEQAEAISAATMSNVALRII
jgi:hypothetical protein